MSASTSFSDDRSGESIRAAFGAARLFRMLPDRWLQLVSVVDAERIAALSCRAAAELIAIELRKIPNRVDVDGEWVFVVPPTRPGGIPVDVVCGTLGWRCFFGGLEEEFESLEHLLPWIERSLSVRYRLRTICVDGWAREYYLEPVDSHSTEPTLARGSSTFLKRFRRVNEVIQQNDLH